MWCGRSAKVVVPSQLPGRGSEAARCFTGTQHPQAVAACHQLLQLLDRGGPVEPLRSERDLAGPVGHIGHASSLEQ
jgi:hypothetical protein